MPSVAPAFIYRAALVRVIDGDTAILDVDLGFHTHAHVTVRLRGFNAPELRTTWGPNAKLVTENALRGASAILVQSYHDVQSFARWVADVWVDGRLLIDILREASVRDGWGGTD